MQILKEKVI